MDIVDNEQPGPSRLLNTVTQPALSEGASANNHVEPNTEGENSGFTFEWLSKFFPSNGRDFRAEYPIFKKRMEAYFTKLHKRILRNLEASLEQKLKEYNEKRANAEGNGKDARELTESPPSAPIPIITGRARWRGMSSVARAMARKNVVEEEDEDTKFEFPTSFKVQMRTVQIEMRNRRGKNTDSFHSVNSVVDEDYDPFN